MPLEIADRSRAHFAQATRQTDERLDFEQLVTDVSVQFINLPAAQVLDAIRDALQRVGESLDLDHCTFQQVLPDGTLADELMWQREGTPVAPVPTPVDQYFPWSLARLQAGELVTFSTADEIPSPTDRETVRQMGIKSAVALPLLVSGRVVGTAGFSMIRAERVWTHDMVHRLRMLAATFANALARRQSEQTVATALAEVKRLSDQLHAENVYLRREFQERLGTGTLVGQSPAVRHVLQLVQQVAPTDSTVLLIGETGTGKELFATQIHELSARRGRAMVRVNCSAIPATLMESELFGREKGAYTGALARQIGRFELADRSSIFLDEIGELPSEVQVKLLRVLEERQIERLGSPVSIRVDTRIIAATHRDLDRRIAEGAFRDDLFYRLNVFPIHVPPLRDRVDDIPLLVWRFVEEFSKAFGKRIEAIPRENMAELQRYTWPGNIRELRNVVERAMIVASGPRLTITLPQSTSAAARRSTRLSDVEREHIRAVVEGAGWRIRGAGGAADRLGLKPTTLETRMAKLGITRPKQG
jgi:transcriptional regulator with GAF, ATPase, and Fis domain